MFLSREIVIKLCKNYTKKYICQIFTRFLVLNRYCWTNTQPIWKRRFPKRDWESQGLLLLFEFHNFSFLLDIIGNVFIRLYHVTSIRIRIIRIRIIVRSEREPDMEPQGCRVSTCTTIEGSSSHVIRTYI